MSLHSTQSYLTYLRDVLGVQSVMGLAVNRPAPRAFCFVGQAELSEDERQLLANIAKAMGHAQFEFRVWTKDYFLTPPAQNLIFFGRKFLEILRDEVPDIRFGQNFRGQKLGGLVTHQLDELLGSDPAVPHRKRETWSHLKSLSGASSNRES